MRDWRCVRNMRSVEPRSIILHEQHGEGYVFRDRFVVLHMQRHDRAVHQVLWHKLLLRARQPDVHGGGQVSDGARKWNLWCMRPDQHRGRVLQVRRPQRLHHKPQHGEEGNNNVRPQHNVPDVLGRSEQVYVVQATCTRSRLLHE